MACPGGCIGGGGQPYGTTNAVRLKRIASIYQADKDLPIRKSHENTAVQELYKEFFGRASRRESHHLLHTHYHDRKKV